MGLRHKAAGHEERPQLEAAGGALLAPAYQVVDLGAELVGGEGLADELRGAQPMRPLEGGEIAVRAEHDDGDAAQLGVGAHDAQELEPVAGGEVEVEDDGGRRLLAAAYEPAKWRASWSRRSVSSSMIARAFLAALGTVTSRVVARLV